MSVTVVRCGPVTPNPAQVIAKRATSAARGFGLANANNRPALVTADRNTIVPKQAKTRQPYQGAPKPKRANTSCAAGASRAAANALAVAGAAVRNVKP